MLLIKFVLQPANSPDTNLNDLCFRSLSKLVQEHEREIEHSAANKDKFWNLIVEQYHKFHSRRHLRDAGTPKPQSLNASSTPTERTITSYRTVPSTRKPFLTIFPQIWTIQTIRWRALWTTKLCMLHSLLPRQIYGTSCDPSICPKP